MPVYTSDALILRTYKLGEADRIVVFLTRDRGKKRGVAKGARRAQVAIHRGAGVADPRAASRITSASCAIWCASTTSSRSAARSRSSRGTRTTPSRSAMSEYFAELIDEWAPEGARRRAALSTWRRRSIDALADGAPTDRLARYFEFWLLRLQGVYPSLSACPGCGGPFDGGAVMPPREHHFVCRRCASAAAARRLARCPALPAQRRRRGPGRARDDSAGRGRRPRAGDGPPAPDQSAPRKGVEVRPGAAAAALSTGARYTVRIA